VNVNGGVAVLATDQNGGLASPPPPDQVANRMGLEVGVPGVPFCCPASCSSTQGTATMTPPPERVGGGSGEVWLGAWALALVAKVPCLVGLLVAVAVAGCFPRDGGKAIHDETPDDTGPPPPGGPRTPMETEGFAKRERGGMVAVGQNERKTGGGYPPPSLPTWGWSARGGGDSSPG